MIKWTGVFNDFGENIATLTSIGSALGALKDRISPLKLAWMVTNFEYCLPVTNWFFSLTTVKSKAL